MDCVLFCVFLDKDKDIYERHMPLFFPLTPEELEGEPTATRPMSAAERWRGWRGGGGGRGEGGGWR